MFVTILSTLLAVFFIYSSLKIDNDLRKITNIKESIKKIEEEATDDMEYSNQLKYAIHYMMSRQYQKAIDALIVLRAEPFTLKDNRKLNSCYYFLAVCYYEQGILDKNVELLAKAVEFINEAIEDNRHPLKIEMIKRFEEENKM
jgi:tetratricopeptide (TPR) repeat protein